jgi:hypothetical protein
MRYSIWAPITPIPNTILNSKIATLTKGGKPIRKVRNIIDIVKLSSNTMDNQKGHRNPLQRNVKGSDILKIAK